MTRPSKNDRGRKTNIRRGKNQENANLKKKLGQKLHQGIFLPRPQPINYSLQKNKTQFRKRLTQKLISTLGSKQDLELLLLDLLNHEYESLKYDIIGEVTTKITETLGSFKEEIRNSDVGLQLTVTLLDDLNIRVKDMVHLTASKKELVELKGISVGAKAVLESKDLKSSYELRRCLLKSSL
jgi:hypothetical protein